MFRRLRPRSAYDVLAVLSFSLVVTGGTALAAHETIFSDDIVDGQVQNPDLGADSVSTAKIQTQGVANSDLAPNSITATRLATDSVETSEIKTGNVFNADIAGNTITSTRIADGTIASPDVQNESLLPEDYVGVYGFSARIDGLAASGTQYGPVTGVASANNNPVYTMISPNLGPADLSGAWSQVRLGAPVAASSTRSFHVSVTSGSDQGDRLLCTIEAGQSECPVLQLTPIHSINDANVDWQLKTTTNGTPGATDARVTFQLRE